MRKYIPTKHRLSVIHMYSHFRCVCVESEAGRARAGDPQAPLMPAQAPHPFRGARVGPRAGVTWKSSQIRAHLRVGVVWFHSGCTLRRADQLLRPLTEHVQRPHEMDKLSILMFSLRSLVGSCYTETLNASQINSESTALSTGWPKMVFYAHETLSCLYLNSKRFKLHNFYFWFR